MNILVVGGGGREHALVWKIKQSERVKKVYCAPGNGGIADIAECVDIPADDVKGLLNFAVRKKIDLTVAGPEQPLVLGIADAFQAKKMKIFGPVQKAARLEGDKAFAKEMMEKYNIPTAGYAVFHSPEQAESYINSIKPPMVVKACGLAAGKGVIICKTRGEAFDAVDQIMNKKAFGEAGDFVIIEEFLTGEEASVLAVSDGDTFVILPASQDHKAIFEGDKGPNTGGMGAYAPAPAVNGELLEQISTEILAPLVKGMKEEGIVYKGIIYAGLMLTAKGPKVLEFNCRFGDPETQAVLPLIESDITDLFLASVDGTLDKIDLKINDDSAVCVIMSSGGYPGDYEKGKIISGLDQVEKDTLVFHSGTKSKGKNLVTSGGRVLGVTASGKTIQDAVKKVYKDVGRITFDGAYYRRDIAYRALKR